jgi:NAD+ kinase
MIGVVGDGIEAVVAGLEAAGESTRTGPPERILAADPEVIVAVGGAVADLVADRGAPEVPVVTVDAGEAFPDIADPAAAVAALRAGCRDTVAYPVFGVAVGGGHAGYALLDAMVVTTGPGRISEFRIDASGELGSFRADGVVVATPAGSHGYARSAGGPRLRPGSDAAAVAPVAAFTMSPDRWVVGLDVTIEITSQRDVPLSLLVDDERTAIDPERTVTVTKRGSIDVIAADPGADGS